MHRPPIHSSLAVLVILAVGCAPTEHDGEPAPGDESAVEASQIEGIPSARVEDHLRGRFPGVRVTQTATGGITVRVWGPTLQSNQEPLYVVDGQPFEVDPGRGLYWLNPFDIASIRVLKDVADTAAWGVRGANGVVVITTKRGDDDH